MDMKTIIAKCLLVIGFISVSIATIGQCDIKHRIYPDGSMQYYIEPVNFYWTEAKSLKGGIVTDKENYYLALQPVPFPGKAEGKKLKGDLVLNMADGKDYRFEHFDTRYMEDDSIMQLLYLVKEEDIGPLENYEVVSAKIDMMGQEGVRTYTFKLHKAALKEQLECFLKEDESKEK